jgi:SPP1 gp7 family putative phage head morphogenesis protein
MANRTKRIESLFTRTLNGLYKSMEEAVRQPKSTQTVIKRLEYYAQSPEYQAWCDELALTMTTQVNEGVSATWREAALEAGRGSDFYAAILESLKEPLGGDFFQAVRENASLIKTFPLDVARDLTDFVARESALGRRSGDILTDLIERYPDTAKTRLNLIARTEVSKTQATLTQARAFSLGLNWYIWRTSEDARVRSSHSHMEGVLVNYNDPPSPEELFPQKDTKPYGRYNAGMTFNCRCYAEVVVDISFVDFPCRVYHANHIERMPRSRFEKLIGGWQ